MGEDSKYGKINYTIKASILLPRGETTNSMEDTFYVAAVPDPSVPKPHEDDLPKVCYSSFYLPRSGKVMQKCRSKKKNKKGTYGF